MASSRLPQEIIDEIIVIAVHDWDIHDVLRLREVNHIFEREVTKLFARTRICTAPKSRTTDIPLSYRLSLVREIVRRPEQERTGFAAWLHAVADYLVTYSKEADPKHSGLITHDEWLDELCEIMAPRKADCQSGRLVFVIEAEYDRKRVKDTAFFVAMLKRHTTLEKAMIRNGMALDTAIMKNGTMMNISCPYLTVLELDLPYIRRNAFEWACQEGYIDTIKRLLEASQLPASYRRWPAALRIVAYRGHIDILKLFLAPGLSVAFDKIAVARSLKDAADNQQWVAVAELLRNYPDQKRESLLPAAIKQGEIELVREILDFEADDKFDYTAALQLAAKAGHADIYRLLFSRGAEKKLGASPNPTSLIAGDIAEGGNVEILRLHWENTLCIHAEPETFHTAVRHGHISMVEYALENGFHKRHGDPEGLQYHALLAAIVEHQIKMVKWLVRRLEINLIRNEDELSPLVMAIDSGSRRMTKFLMKSGGLRDQSELSLIDFSPMARRDRRDRFAESSAALPLKFDWVLPSLSRQWKVNRAASVALSWNSNEV